MCVSAGVDVGMGVGGGGRVSSLVPEIRMQDARAQVGKGSRSRPAFPDEP